MQCAVAPVLVGDIRRGASFQQRSNHVRMPPVDGMAQSRPMSKNTITFTPAANARCKKRATFPVRAAELQVLLSCRTFSACRHVPPLA